MERPILTVPWGAFRIVPFSSSSIDFIRNGAQNQKQAARLGLPAFGFLCLRLVVLHLRRTATFPIDQKFMGFPANFP